MKGSSLLFLRTAPCPEAPAAGTKKEPEIIKPTIVVHSINGNIVHEKAADETDGRDETMNEPTEKTIAFPFKATLDRLSSGARKKAEGQKKE